MAQALAILGCIAIFLWVFWGLPAQGHTLGYDLKLLARAYLIILIYACILWKKKRA